MHIPTKSKGGNSIDPRLLHIALKTKDRAAMSTMFWGKECVTSKFSTQLNYSARINEKIDSKHERM